jgi:regulator of replication initiation timing
MNQMKEIFDKTHVIEEENASLKDEASKLNQERVALIEEKDSLSLEKRELHTAVSKLNSKLAEISACIEETEKMALAEKSKVSPFLLVSVHFRHWLSIIAGVY